MKSTLAIRSAVAAAALLAVSGAVQASPQHVYVPNLHPQLTSAEIARLQQAPKGACVAGKPIAVSAFGEEEGSSGTDSIVEYPFITTNESGAWVNGDTFVAPCSGVYSFSISYNTDSYDPCPTSTGTQDDIEVYFVESTPPLYDDSQVIGDSFGAWRGQLADNVKRGEAAYTLVIRLDAGDAVQTKVHSDGNGLRCLWRTNFAAVREFK